MYRLVFDTILAALFWMHCNLRRLNLDRLLKSIFSNTVSTFMFLQLTESSLVTTTATTEEATISVKDRTSFADQIRSLIVETVKVRKKAGSVGHTKYVSALNSYIRSLARLMKLVKESTFDKEKVANIVTVLGNRVKRIDADLEGKVSTVPGLQEGEGTSAASPTDTTTAEISDRGRKVLTEKTRSLLMEVAKVRKKAAALAEKRYVSALSTYIRSLAKILKLLEGSSFEKEKVERILTGLRKRTGGIKDYLEARASTTASTEPVQTETSGTVPPVKVNVIHYSL